MMGFNPRLNISYVINEAFTGRSSEIGAGISPQVGGLRSQPYGENSHVIVPLVYQLFVLRQVVGFEI